LNDVIENMQLKHPNLSVKINIDNDFTILADEFHFTNIIYNLLDNSIKYCDRNPTINISVSEDNNQIKLDFTDNGIGISSKNLNFIFDKFYRIPSTKSNEVNGFGLGLYYVKKICTQHNWKIFATNNAEKGITLSIIIPK
jgi:two-component system phosphate regulon sensor histidine kinase PhoR